MATTKKYLDYDGLVQYTGKVKKAINDAAYSHGVTDIEGTPSASAPTIANTVNATNNARSGNFTVDGSPDTFAYYDTTYGNASTTKDGLMSSSDKTKLNGIASGAEVNVQSDWNQTTTTADDYIKNKPTFKTINNVAITGSGNIAVQTPLTFDDAPTANSNNPVKSGGVKTAVDDASKTVKQTAASGSDTLSLLLEGTTNSDQIGEAYYTADLRYTPSTRTTVISTNNGDKSFNFTFADAKLTLGGASSYIDSDEYTGNALGTESALESQTQSTDGASMIGFYDEVNDESTTVAAAINNINQVIGGGSGDESLFSRVVALETNKADKTAAVGTITGTSGGNETGSYSTISGTAKTFTYNNNKVAQTSSSANSDIPLLLASDATPSTGGANYDADFKFNPSSNTLKVGTGTLTATQYSGNAATATKATQDGSGNTITTYYATKAALDELTNKWTGQFKIATSAEATAIAQGNASSLQLGYIYLVLDSTASSPNVYDEYIKVALGTSPETYSVEKIGTTDAGVDVVSLTTAEINTIWATTAAAS